MNRSKLFGVVINPKFDGIIQAVVYFISRLYISIVLKKLVWYTSKTINVVCCKFEARRTNQNKAI